MALLLIVKDEQGTISVSLWDLVLAGAVLCDLVLEERLAVDVEADTCTVVDERPLDDVLLDGCLKLFLDAKRPIAAKHALHHIGRNGSCIDVQQSASVAVDQQRRLNKRVQQPCERLGDRIVAAAL